MGTSPARVPRARAGTGTSIQRAQSITPAGRRRHRDFDRFLNHISLTAKRHAGLRSELEELATAYSQRVPIDEERLFVVVGAEVFVQREVWRLERLVGMGGGDVPAV